MPSSNPFTTQRDLRHFASFGHTRIYLHLHSLSIVILLLAYLLLLASIKIHATPLLEQKRRVEFFLRMPETKTRSDKTPKMPCMPVQNILSEWSLLSWRLYNLQGQPWPPIPGLPRVVHASMGVLRYPFQNYLLDFLENSSGWLWWAIRALSWEWRWCTLSCTTKVLHEILVLVKWSWSK